MTEYLTLLALGCMIGMQHAMEADHLAAVAALSNKTITRRALVLRGSMWGLGHTITLLSICGVLLLLGGTISSRAAATLEFLVGVMIVLLGFNVLRSVWVRRPHFHVHGHSKGERHLHLHTHESAREQHASDPHDHPHHELGLRRAMIVGMAHGAAGSAGLLIVAAVAESGLQAMGFILAFGLGSIAGMAFLTFCISFPARWMEQCAGWVNAVVFVTIGCTAIVIGGRLIGDNWSAI